MGQIERGQEQKSNRGQGRERPARAEEALEDEEVSARSEAMGGECHTYSRERQCPMLLKLRAQRVIGGGVRE